MSYKNPVIAIDGVDHGDPAVIKYNGCYYLYHTGPREIRVYQSTNLVHWDECGIALYASDDPNHWAQIDLWAPEVIHENGMFYMYVTGAVKKEDGTGNDEIRRIGVATSKSPIGPFTLAEKPLTEEWSIDAHPFKDEDGTYYMFYNVRNDSTRGPNNVIGTGNVVDRMEDLVTLSGNPTMVVAPEHLWEGNKEHTFFWNEGPFVLKRNGVYYQMYSAGFFGDDTYGVYYATSTTPMGTKGMEDKSWSKWKGGQPILQTNEACHGPGHHVVVKGPNGVDDFIVYHGYEPDENVRERRVRVGRFKWEGDHIWLEPPVTDTLDLPESPTFDGRFLSTTPEVNEELKEHIYENFHFETNIALQGKETSSNILTYYTDDENYVQLTLDQTNQQLILTTVLDHTVEAVQEYPLPPNYHSSAYHFIILKKQKSTLSFYLDNLLAFKITDYLKNVGKIKLSGNVKGTILTETE